MLLYPAVLQNYYSFQSVKLYCLGPSFYRPFRNYVTRSVLTQISRTAECWKAVMTHSLILVTYFN